MGFSFLARKGVEVHFEDQSIICYPLSLKALTLLEQIADPLTQAMSTIFGANRNDTEKVIKDVVNQQLGGTMTETQVCAVSPQMAAYRDSQRRSAISQAVKAIFSDRNRIILGRIIMDALRDEFPRKEHIDNDRVLEFMDEIDLEALARIGGGIFEANKKIFGPFSDKLSEVMNEMTTKKNFVTETLGGGATSKTSSSSSPEKETSPSNISSISTPIPSMPSSKSSPDNTSPES